MRVLLVLATFVAVLAFAPTQALASLSDGVIRAGGLAGDKLYAVGGDQQSELVSIQDVVLSKSGMEIEYHEFETMQEGFDALKRGEIDCLYPMVSYADQVEPLGLAATDGVYTISWDIIFTGSYSESKLDKIAVPGGRLAPFYCKEVFPKSELVLCDSRSDCLDAVIEGKATCAIFNGFQVENITQNGAKYGVLEYTILPTDTEMSFVVREDDTELLDLLNDCIAHTSELEKTDYMVTARGVSLAESAREVLMARYRTFFTITITVLALLAAGFFLILHRVILPLRVFNQSMAKNERLPEVGSTNLRRLAETYNRLYDENAETQRLLRHDAEHDGLTGVLNRAAYEQELELCERSGMPHALMILDVDKFKDVNDSYGHAVGDLVLKKVAILLESSFRAGDYVCRLGGDEFAVIAVNPKEGFDEVLRRKIEAINESLLKAEDGLPSISVSAGAALALKDSDKGNTYRRADAALYAVKNSGRGGFQFTE